MDGESIPATPASSPVSSCCDQRHRIIEFSEKKTKEKLEEKQHGGSKCSFNRIFIIYIYHDLFIIFHVSFREIGSSQAIATLGVAAVALGEGKENSRIFGQVIRKIV